MRLGESLKRLVPSMDRYHKVICPTASLCLTMIAVYVACQVFLVQRLAAERNAEQQQAAAERSNRELDYRIQRMDDLNKQLTAQSNDLTDLKRRLEQQSTEATIQQKRHEELAKLSEDRAAVLSVTAQLQQHMAQVMMDQSRNEAQSRSVLLGPSHSSIAILAMLQSKSPIYTPEEQELINAIRAIETGQRELLTVLVTRMAEDNTRYNNANNDFRKTLLNAPKEKVQELLDKQLAEVNRIGSESQNKFEKETAEVFERVTKAMARADELSRKLFNIKKKPSE